MYTALSLAVWACSEAPFHSIPVVAPNGYTGVHLYYSHYFGGPLKISIIQGLQNEMEYDTPMVDTYHYIHLSNPQTTTQEGTQMSTLSLG